MCGIFGCYSRNGHNRIIIDKQKVFDSLAQRGPDGNGFLDRPPVFLGHTRLSIIDLSSGNQPMSNEDGSLYITFNGEIYNFKELRNELIDKGHRFETESDTEVILHLYEDYGRECLHYLRGMFAFALWDTRKEELFIARDRIGVKPLVYSSCANGFYFASEVQSLFALNQEIPKICDLKAIDYYLTFQYIPSPRTGFTAIKKLEPAHYLIIKDGLIIAKEKYWDTSNIKADISFGDACEGIRELVVEATRIRLRSDVPLGAFLSGGVDSSIVVAVMAKLLNSPIKTYAAGFGVSGYDDLPRAREIADLYRTDHTEFHVDQNITDVLSDILYALGEPMGDTSIIPTYYISKLTSASVKVALTGDGGDEIFAGYRRYAQLSFLNKLDSCRLTMLWKLLRTITIRIEGLINSRRRGRMFPYTKMDRALYLKDIERYYCFITLMSETEKRKWYTPLMFAAQKGSCDYLYDKFRGSGKIADYLYFDQKTFLPDDILFKVDACSMLNSLECRSPFLDHKLVEFVASLPDEYKLHGRVGKYILKESFKSYAPPGFFDRPKLGFAAPTHVWFRGEFKKWCQHEILSSSAIAKILRKDIVGQILMDANGNSKLIWCLLVLSQWFKRFGVVI